MQPTHVIYRAWQSTPRPIHSPPDPKGEIKPLLLIEPEEVAGYDASYTGDCYICGELVSGGVPKRVMLSNTFTDGARARAPEATHICRACAFCMQTSPHGRASIRWYPLVASADGMCFLTRPALRSMLLSPPEPPFVFLLPIGQKKHLCFKAQTAFSRDHFPVALEEEVIWIGPEFADMSRFVCALRGVGFGMAEIENIDFHYDRVKQFSMSFLDAVAARLLAMRKNRQFAVALYASQADGKEESACYLDSTLGTNTTPPPRK